MKCRHRERLDTETEHEGGFGFVGRQLLVSGMGVMLVVTVLNGTRVIVPEFAIDDSLLGRDGEVGE